MIQEQLDKIEKRLEASESVKEGEKTDLLNLLSNLRTEIDSLSRTHCEEAESITGFAELSTREATRQEKNPALLKLATEGLAFSVEGFETSHPKLVEIVNAFCTILANLGI